MPTENIDRSVPQAKIMIGNTDSITGSAGVFEHVNPANGKVQAQVPMAGKAEMDAAVDCAQQAFETWRKTNPAERARLLNKLADLIVENTAEFQRLATLEGGTPYTTAVGGTMLATEWTRYYAGWADKIDGQVVSAFPASEFAYTVPEPYGVIGIIITWNGPLISLGMKVAPALAAGNTVVIKPAEQTPFVACLFADLVRQAGFPEGVVNMLPGGAEAAQALVAHPQVKKITFTGGPTTARKILHQCADLLKPVVLELGGKSANIVFDDADLDFVAAFSTRMSVGLLSGQGCELPTRLLVQSNIYDALVAKVKACVESFPAGDPFDPNTVIGPVINQAACERILNKIEQAKATGAGKLICGGYRLGGELADGYFIAPAVFSDVKADSELAQEEIFGPVLIIQRFETEAEAIEIANSTEYGLGGYIQTNDLKRAHRVAEAMQTGFVHLNGSRNIPACAPFGGLGLSGFGKEGGRQGLEEFIRYKTISLTQ